VTRERKGSERYATLPARDLLPVQVSHLRRIFDSSRDRSHQTLVRQAFARVAEYHSGNAFIF